MTCTMKIMNSLTLDLQVYLSRSNQKGGAMLGISKRDNYTTDNRLHNYQVAERAETKRCWGSPVMKSHSNICLCQEKKT